MFKMSLDQNETNIINNQFTMINEQLITNSIMLSALLELLTKKGIISRDEMQNSINETQQRIIDEQKKMMEKQNDSSKIITPEDIRRQVKK